jgi:signal transduction histidine kinase
MLLGLSVMTANATVWNLFNPRLRELKNALQDVGSQLDSLPPIPVRHQQQSIGFHSWLYDRENALAAVTIDLGEVRSFDSIVIVPAFFNGIEAYAFPIRFRIDTATDANFNHSDVVIDHTDRDCQPSNAPWHIPADGSRARYIRFSVTKLRKNHVRHFFCLSELLVFSEGQNIAMHATVIAPSRLENLPQWSPAYLVDGWTSLGLPTNPHPSPGHGWLSAESPQPDTPKWVQLDLGETQALDEIRLIPIYPYVPEGFPVRFKVEASLTPDFITPIIIFDSTQSDFPNPGYNPVGIDAQKSLARYIRITATRLWRRKKDPADYIFALSEVQVWSKGRNIAPNAKVTVSDEYVGDGWSHTRLVDNFVPTGKIVAEDAWLQKLSRRRELIDAQRDLKAQQQAALDLAQSRAAWSGGIGTSSLTLLLLTGLYRARVRRKNEMSALRQRIASDLHDEVGSNLACIALLTTEAEDQISASSTPILTEIRQIAEETSASMRDLVWVIQPGAPGDLIGGLHHIADRMLRGLQVELYAPENPLPQQLTPHFKRETYLIFRELLQNIVRHSRATQVNIRFENERGQFHLTIQDNGCGYLESQVSGNGLSNIRTRTTQFGGSCHIRTEVGHGCETHITLPWR